MLARHIGAVRDLVRLGEQNEAIRMFPTVSAAVDAIGAARSAALTPPE